MARIAGINIPMNKHVVIGLTHIYGIGSTRAKLLLREFGSVDGVRSADVERLAGVVGPSAAAAVAQYFRSAASG